MQQDVSCGTTGSGVARPATRGRAKTGWRGPVRLALGVGLAVLVVGFSGGARADSGPDPELCALQAAAHADRSVSGHPTGEDVAGAAIEGAIVGALAGPGSSPGGWSVRGARRGARLGGGLAALDQLDRPDLSAWQRAFDAAYAACLAGQPLPLSDRERCRSSGTVTGSGHGGLYGASSRRDCR